MEYTKRNLRHIRDFTDSSRSGPEDFSRPGLAAADKRPNAVRCLWPGANVEGPDTTFDIAGSDDSKKPGEEFESASKPSTSRSEGVGSKRSWSSAAVGPATKLSPNPVPPQPDVTLQNIPPAQLGCSEDYFRLLAHIFNCIFR